MTLWRRAARGCGCWWRCQRRQERGSCWRQRTWRVTQGEHKSFTNRKTGGCQLTPGQRQQQRQQQRRGRRRVTQEPLTGMLHAYFVSTGRLWRRRRVVLATPPQLRHSTRARFPRDDGTAPCAVMKTARQQARTLQARPAQPRGLLDARVSHCAFVVLLAVVITGQRGDSEQVRKV
jgi:hypothetical protein